jgi:hypothetical protein
MSVSSFIAIKLDMSALIRSDRSALRTPPVKLYKAGIVVFLLAAAGIILGMVMVREIGGVWHRSRM